MRRQSFKDLPKWFGWPSFAVLLDSLPLSLKCFHRQVIVPFDAIQRSVAKNKRGAFAPRLLAEFVEVRLFLASGLDGRRGSVEVGLAVALGWVVGGGLDSAGANSSASFIGHRGSEKNAGESLRRCV